MHYDTDSNLHGLKHDPFKALAVPRPIGWVSSIGKDGSRNLAPYSFFNAVADRPPMVMFSSVGRKDSLKNIEETGEFVCSLANWDLRHEMNMSSAAVGRGVDEFALAGLEPAASKLVKAPRVARSPAAFECRHWKTIEMPANEKRPDLSNLVVFGIVVAIYIDDSFVQDGLVNTGAMRPLARLGYMDYAVVTPETMFTLNRPEVAADGKSATVNTKEWDGVYR